jgi:hypothetical protein
MIASPKVKENHVAHEQEVLQVMKLLQVADKHIVGEIMSVRVGWRPGASSTNNSYKALMALVEMGALGKGNGFFRIPGCKSDYGEHARLLTMMLAMFLKLPFQTTIFREHTIAEIGLRPDALILLTDTNRGLCMVLEVLRYEGERSLQTKRNVWKEWPQAIPYLSQLFGTPIGHFDFVTSDEFQQYLREVVHEK